MLAIKPETGSSGRCANGRKEEDGAATLCCGMLINLRSTIEIESDKLQCCNNISRDMHRAR